MLAFCICGVRQHGLPAAARAGLLVAIGLAAACSGGQDAAQAADAPIGIQTSQLFVTIENRAGGPLINISAAIVSVGGLPFTRLISRMETSEKRDIPLSDFAGRDGTTFNLRIVRPKSVRVTAEDLASKKYEVEVAWK
jgi:hypothetical protein